MNKLLNVISLPICCLLLIAVTVQCKSSESKLAPKIAGLIGTWKLIEPDSTYGVTLVFTLDTAHPPQDITSFKASGRSAVNAYSLNLFAAIDGMMMADQVSSTDMAGTPAAMQFEQSYLKNLKAVARYELLTDHQLRLYHGGDQPRVLVYEKQN
ncbi:META domain-containing protein [Spirosoma gilvum]